MPGSGKSTLGKSLAEQLSIAFVDLDTEIEEQEKISVQAIFENQGELYFRKLEKNKLEELAHLPHPLLIATGGGTPCFHDNMKLMNELGLTIFIDVPIDEIVNRLVATQLEKRPLFKDLSKQELIEKLSNQFEKRKDFYLKAQHIITSEDSIEAIIKQL